MIYISQDGAGGVSGRYDAVLFDLLTALLDSWSLWNAAADSEHAERLWRAAYLKLTYGTGACRPYEPLAHESAEIAGLAPTLADDLERRWDELAPGTTRPRRSSSSKVA